MRKKSIVSIATFVVLMFVGASGSAIGTGTCDPNVENCTCSNTDRDFCAKVDVSNIPSADNPAELRDLLNLETYYDDENGVWRYTYDATELPGRGLVKLHSNNGIWEDGDELTNYITTLLGRDLDDLTCDQVMPSTSSRGELIRLDDEDDVLASDQDMPLVASLVSNSAGKVIVDGVEFDLDLRYGSPGDKNVLKLDNATGASASFHQQSEMLDFTQEIEVPKLDCGPPTFRKVSKYGAETSMDEVSGNTVEPRAECTLPDNCGHVLVEKDFFDEVRVWQATNRTWDFGGRKLEVADHHVTTDSSHIYDPLSYVCGFGQAQIGQFEFTVTTKTGSSAPSTNCSNKYSGPSEYDF